MKKNMAVALGATALFLFIRFYLRKGSSRDYSHISAQSAWQATVRGLESHTNEETSLVKIRI